MTSVNTPGAGLGLTLARECAEYPGGTVSIVAEKKDVAEFKVVLPVHGAFHAPPVEES